MSQGSLPSRTGNGGGGATATGNGRASALLSGGGGGNLSAKDLLSRPTTEAKVVVEGTRQSHQLDVDSIRQLLNPFSSSLFGNTDPAILIERSSYCLSSLSPENDVVAFGAFCNYPKQPRMSRRIPRHDWQGWIHEHYSNTDDVNTVNTVFCHQLLAKMGFQLGMFTEIITSMFLQMPDVDHIFFTAPEEADVGVALRDLCGGDGGSVKRRPESLASEEKERELTSKPLLPYPKLLRCSRQHHVPMLHVRQARQADSDDITALFSDEDKASLCDQYGEHFIAEILKQDSENNVSLVAEHYGTLVGFVNTTCNVDVAALCKNYQLEIFNNLRPRPQTVVDNKLVDDQLTKSSEVLTATSQTIDGPPGIAVHAPSPEPPATDSKQSSSSIGKTGGKSTTSGTSVTSILKSSASKTSSAALGTASTTAAATTSGVKLEDVTAGKLSSGSVADKSKSKLGAQSRVTFKEPPGADSESSTSSSSEVALSPVQSAVIADGSDDASHSESVVMDQTRNVFCVRLFAMDESHNTRYIDMIHKLFQVYEGMEYCVATQESTRKELPIYRCFMHTERVIGNNESSELYLLHRNALLRDYKVSYVNTTDVDAVEEYLGHLDEGAVALEDVRKYLFAGREPLIEGGALLHAVKVQCCGEVIAVAVLRDVLDPDWLRAHYDIEQASAFDWLHPDEHKYLNHFIINPGFLPRQRFILGEILHVVSATCCYYEMYEGRNRPAQRAKPFTMTPALDLMAWARPRRQIVYPKNTEIMPSEQILRKKPRFGLFQLNRKLLYAEREVINTRIVIVGASDAGLATLESLTNSPYVRFNNLVVIDPQGISGMNVPRFTDSDDFLPNTLSYPPSLVSQSGLNVWVNVIYAKMSSLNRNRREVILDNNCRVPYDELILCTGMQYSGVRGLKAPSEEVYGMDVKRMEDEYKQTVISYNTLAELEDTMALCKHKLSKTKGRVIVYGNNVEAFAAVQMLVTNQVVGERIDLVLPTQGKVWSDGEPLLTDCFEEDAITLRIDTELSCLGVQVFPGMTLLGWTSHQDEDANHKHLLVTFRRANLKDDRQLKADALFYFDKKTVDQDAFLAMTSSRLVFDSRLVIDEKFTTTDPLIHAMGPCTKFQRKFHRDDWQPERFSSKEMGHMVGKLLMDKYASSMDDYAEDEQEEPNRQQSTAPSARIPMFNERLSMRASLPGNWTYIRITGPPRMDLGRQDKSMDEVINSFTEQDGGLQLKFVRGRVDTITVFSRIEKNIETDNITSLWGYHSNMMKHMIEQQREEEIKDVFELLRREFMIIYYHDRFSDLQGLIHSVLEQPRDGGNQDSLMEVAAKMMQVTRGPLDSADTRELKRQYQQSGIINEVHRLIVEFITRNHYHLPMYALPNILIT
ncbi:cilia- and flagella-associated protein 61-like [Sycon ciliatum]|uniref:cilia- and flagella-associated protein 61-like n=1 Tax=Sycon ciliatum TaxID=27933 RepID=UPI0031F6CE76